MPVEVPYGDMVKVSIFVMTHEAVDPIVKDGVIYTFVIDDIRQATLVAPTAAGDRSVSLRVSSISRPCLQLGLVDEIVLDMAPVLSVSGISLFGGLEQQANLERISTSAYAGETHKRFRMVRWRTHQERP